MKKTTAGFIAIVCVAALAASVFVMAGDSYTIHDINDVDARAYEGYTTSPPSPNVNLGTEVNTENYTALQASDDVHAYHYSGIDYEFHRFAFHIDEPLAGKQLVIVYEGHGVVAGTVGVNIYVWNNVGASWQHWGSHNEPEDKLLLIRLTDSTDYVNDTGWVHVLARAGAPALSCPFLYTWDGSSYSFVTDMSSAGGVGWFDASGTYPRSHPYPEDYAVVDGALLQPDDGVYKIVLAEDQDEIAYLDEVRLYAIDHAPDVEVYSSLGYSYDTVFPFTLHTVRDPQPPVSARDGDGRDITDVIATVDNVSTQGYQFAFDTIELDFGDLSDAEQIKLVYNGWVKWPTEGENSIRYAYLAAHPEEQYSYPNYAEVINEHGNWERVEFPKVQAKARTKALDITDWFTGDIYKLRLHTWFETWFDYIAVDTSPDEAVMLQEAALTAADLYWKGPAVQRDRPGAPSIPEFYTTAPLSGFNVWQGNFTRYGDVLPLLTDTDDMYVVMHAGDAITLTFDELPSSGLERDYLVFTDAFYQEMFVRYLFGRQVGHVEPLPFNGMPYYPYPDTMSYPYDAEHVAYLEEYNTREFNPALGGGHNTIYTDYVKVVVASERRVTNLDTGETFTTIQAAIDDTDTIDGHTLLVNASAEEYGENVRVTKSLTIMGQDADATIINGMGGGIGFTIMRNDTVLRNLTIYNGEAGIYVHNDSFALHDVILDNVTVIDCDVGIHLFDVNYSTIKHTIIDNHYYTVHPGDAIGMWLQHAHYNTAAHVAIGNIQGGKTIAVQLQNANSNCFTGLSIGDLTSSSGNPYAMHLTDADNNSISAGNFGDVEGNGEDAGFITLGDADNNTIMTCMLGNLDAVDDARAITFFRSHNNTLTTGDIGNINGSDEAIGVRCGQSFNNSIFTGSFGDINGTDAIGVYLIDSNNSEITTGSFGHLFSSGAPPTTYGVRLESSCHNNVTMGNFTALTAAGSAAYGIFIESGWWNNVSAGWFGDIYGYNTAHGIYLNGAHNATVVTGDFANITGNRGGTYGVRLQLSENNSVTTGAFSDITGLNWDFVYGVYLDNCYNNEVSTASFGNIHGDDSAYGVSCVRSAYNTVATQHFGNISSNDDDTSIGIKMFSAFNNTVVTGAFGNISSTLRGSFGIMFESSENNSVTAQDFDTIYGPEEAYGIRVDNSFNNSIATQSFTAIISDGATTSYGINITDSCDNNVTTGSFGDIEAWSGASYGILLNRADRNIVVTHDFGILTGSGDNDTCGIYMENTDGNYLSTGNFSGMSAENCCGVSLSESFHNNMSMGSFGDVNGGYVFGLYIDSSSGNNISTHAFGDFSSSTLYGIFLSGSGGNNISTGSFGNLTGYPVWGLYLAGANGNTISTGDFGNISVWTGAATAMHLDGADHNNITTGCFGTIAASDGFAYGIHATRSDGNTFTMPGFDGVNGSAGASGIYLPTIWDGGNIFASMFIRNVSSMDGDAHGVWLSKATGTVFTDIAIDGIWSRNDTAYGIRLSSVPDGSDHNTFTDCSVANVSAPAWWSFHSCEWSDGNVITNLTVASYPTAVSFTYGNGIAVKGVESPYAWPAAWTDIGKFVDVSNVTETSWINLSIHYADGDVWGADESMLGVYHYNETGMSWELVPSLVYPDDNYVQSNISSFSQYGIFTRVVRASMHLRTPWNLITVPVQHSWTSRTLGENISGCKVVTRWDVDQQMYIDYIMGIDSPGNPEFAILDGVGYFVGVTHDSWFNLSGPFIESISVTLQPGFNLVGWANVENTTAESLGDNITRCQFVTKWDEIRPQEFYTHVVGSVLNDFTVSTGRGVFVYLTGTTNVNWNGGR